MPRSQWSDFGFKYEDRDETNQSVPWCLEVEQCAKNSLPTTSGASQKAVLVLTIGVDDRWYACSELDDGQKPLVW